jgi:hypothetical protein
VGWALDNIVVTNISQLVNLTPNITAATNFTFTPTLATNYVLQVSGILFNEFPIEGGPVRLVAAVVGPPVIVMGAPVIVGTQVQLNFNLASGLATTFRLLQTDQLGQPWVTNANASFTTNILGSSYRFTTTNGPVTRFYRIQTP